MPTPKSEPVMTLVATLLGALAGVLVAFGVHLTGQQIDALVHLAVAAVACGLWVRSKVTPASHGKAAVPQAPAPQITVTGAE